MGNEARNDCDMANVWKNQTVDRVEIPLEEIRQKAQRLATRVWWRNLREYVAGAIVTASFGYNITVFHSALTRAGCGLMFAGTLFVLCTLHKRGAARTVPVELASRTCVDYHRQELQRQRDLLRKVWSWYLLPFVPGLLVFLLGLLELTLEQPNASAHMGAIVATFALVVVGCAVGFVGIGKLNQLAARKLQSEIDVLDKLEKES